MAPKSDQELLGNFAPFAFYRLLEKPAPSCHYAPTPYQELRENFAPFALDELLGRFASESYQGLLEYCARLAGYGLLQNGFQALTANCARTSRRPPCTSCSRRSCRNPNLELLGYFALIDSRELLGKFAPSFYYAPWSHQELLENLMPLACYGRLQSFAPKSYQALLRKFARLAIYDLLGNVANEFLQKIARELRAAHFPRTAR